MLLGNQLYHLSTRKIVLSIRLAYRVRKENQETKDGTFPGMDKWVSNRHYIRCSRTGQFDDRATIFHVDQTSEDAVRCSKHLGVCAPPSADTGLAENNHPPTAYLFHPPRLFPEK